MDLLESFKWMYESIPAYKKFIDEQGINPVDVKSPQDIPIMDKNSYVEKYPLKERIRPDAEIALFAQSSGTTGEPVIWPISKQSLENFKRLSEAARAFHRADKTLVVISVALNWHAGLSFLATSLLGLDEGFVAFTTDKNLSGLGKVLELGGYDSVIMFSYSDFAEHQFDILRRHRAPKYLTWFPVGGPVSFELSQRIKKEFLDSEISIIPCYGSSEGGILGFDAFFTREGVKPYPDDLKKRLAQEYRSMGATVFTPLPGTVIECVEKMLCITNITTAVPTLRYMTYDMGGKVEGIETPVPLYWISGRVGNEIKIDGATVNLRPVKAFISAEFGITEENDIMIQVSKSRKVYPAWTISIRTVREFDREALAQKITDIVIENSYEVRARVESGDSPREHFKPKVNVIQSTK